MKQKKSAQQTAVIAAVTVLLLLAVVLCLLMLNRQIFMGYEPEDDHDEFNREEIVRRVSSYIEVNKHLPESLSELGFEQMPALYRYRGNSLDLVKIRQLDYVIEYWDTVDSIRQYSSEYERWFDEIIYEFEPPANMDTIAGICQVYYMPRDKMRIRIDSTQSNTSISSILDYDKEIVSDSIAYLRYYTSDTIRMEGWVAYPSHRLPEYIKEFGPWKYYDGKGNCYRKFWNYKNNGRLVYEADR